MVLEFLRIVQTGSAVTVTFLSHVLTLPCCSTCNEHYLTFYHTGHNGSQFFYHETEQFPIDQRVVMKRLPKWEANSAKSLRNLI